MEATEALRADIEKHARKLEHFDRSIIKCKVVMEPAEHHHHNGNRFVVHVRLTLPGGRAGRRAYPVRGPLPRRRLRRDPGRLRHIPFHRNSLVDANFNKVSVGDRVRFTEAPSDEGSWASTVHLSTHDYGG